MNPPDLRDFVVDRRNEDTFELYVSPARRFLNAQRVDEIARRLDVIEPFRRAAGLERCRVAPLGRHGREASYDRAEVLAKVGAVLGTSFGVQLRDPHDRGASLEISVTPVGAFLHAWLPRRVVEGSRSVAWDGAVRSLLCAWVEAFPSEAGYAAWESERDLERALASQAARDGRAARAAALDPWFARVSVRVARTRADKPAPTPRWVWHTDAPVTAPREAVLGRMTAALVARGLATADEVAPVLAAAKLLDPVTTRLHADVAPLLQAIIADQAYVDAHAVAALFDGYVPPVPEQCPLADAVPCDLDADARDEVDAPALFRPYYRYVDESEAADWFREFRRAFSPAGLARIDDLARRGLLASPRTAALAVPALGTYLGQAIVAGLGGRWALPRGVDRETLSDALLEHTAVVVGTRALFPYRRARALAHGEDVNRRASKLPWPESVRARVAPLIDASFQRFYGAAASIPR